MTRQDVLNSLRNLTTDRQIQWMFDFGYLLTVSARGAYVAGELAGDAARLMGFNELQHQIYGRSGQLRRGEEWTLENFLDALIEKAKVYKIEGDLGSAISGLAQEHSKLSSRAPLEAKGNTIRRRFTQDNSGCQRSSGARERRSSPQHPRAPFIAPSSHAMRGSSP